MLKDFGDDMHCQFLEIIKSLLDTYSPAGQVCRLFILFVISKICINHELELYRFMTS